MVCHFLSLGQKLVDFQNFFAVALSGTFAVKESF